MNAKKTIAALYNENYELKAKVAAITKAKLNQDTLLLVLFNDISKIKLMKDFKPFQALCAEMLSVRKPDHESK